MNRRLPFAFAVALAAIACAKEPTGPAPGSYAVAVQTGDAQFGTRGSLLSEPFQVIVTDPATKRAKANIQVQWSIAEGSGATLTNTTSTTDSRGVASTQLRLGPALGIYRVEATTGRPVGAPARFTARAVDVPSIANVTPASVNAGDTVVITGQNFSPTIDDNTVTFSGFRGRVVTASTTQLRVVVPLCVPSRAVAVQAALGSVVSNTSTVTVAGTAASALELARGQVRAFSDQNELSCFRLPGGVPGLTLLLVPQNISEVIGSIAALEVSGLIAGGAVTAITERGLPATTPADAWEWKLRRSERELARSTEAVLHPQMSSSALACPAPVLGVRCEFQVINKKTEFEKIVAELKAITTRALVYQDVATSATAGLTTADFTTLGQQFDDPIYAANVAAFGTPSDLDSNGKIIILLTPVVNALTERGASGFIAGFFYGCDLLSRNACSGSNQAEIFYALTTDPTAQYSDARSRNTVMTSLPAVIAHEFQHMIHFAQRGNSTDALWLSEGLAHHAEDIVADAYEARGDNVNATAFRNQNYIRSNRFLRATSGTSLLAEEDVGSLELRGAAWLFVKYLVGQYGNEILTKLVRSQQSSVANVTAQTAKSWASLMSDWGVALWADNAPELANATVRREHTFPNINLREKLRNGDGSYPLRPRVYNFEDFIHRVTLTASSQDYIIVQAGASSKQLNLTFAGQGGSPFALNAAPQMTILRIN